MSCNDKAVLYRFSLSTIINTTEEALFLFPAAFCWLSNVRCLVKLAPTRLFFDWADVHLLAFSKFVFDIKYVKPPLLYQLKFCFTNSHVTFETSCWTNKLKMLLSLPLSKQLYLHSVSKLKEELCEVRVRGTTAFTSLSIYVFCCVI